MRFRTKLMLTALVALVAATFARPVDVTNPSKVQDLMRWCLRQIGGAA